MICIVVGPSGGLIGAAAGTLGLVNGDAKSVIFDLRRCFVKISGNDFKVDSQKRARDFVVTLLERAKLLYCAKKRLTTETQRKMSLCLRGEAFSLPTV
jgi:hypothetical protein